MTLRRLPEIRAFERPEGLSFGPDERALKKWNGALRLEATTDNSIDIFDIIGEDYWSGGGVTAKSVQAKLKGLGDVVVNVNSPGGDLFEGVAIYNLLRAHAGKVTVNVLGLAASAASIIAMAGDSINIGAPAFLMIHNAWTLVMGDRHDLADASAFLEPFDAAMADVYAARSDIPVADIAAMMDNETWMSGKDAVEKGFADNLLSANAVAEDQSVKAKLRAPVARRRVEAGLATAGMSRSEIRALIKDIKQNSEGTPRAVPVEPMPSAGLASLAASLARLDTALSK